MKLTCKIEAITSVSQGISSMGKPWKSCSLIIVCSETIGNGNMVKNRFLIHCLNDACDKVEDAIEPVMNHETGEIPGTWEITCFSSVRRWYTREGKEITNQEINLTDIERRSDD